MSDGRPVSQGVCPSLLAVLKTIVAVPWCLFRILDPNFSIPDPNFSHPGSEYFPSRVHIKEFIVSILIQKMVYKFWEIWSGLFIPDLDPDFLSIPDPGVKKAPDPWSRTLLKTKENRKGKRVRIRNKGTQRKFLWRHHTWARRDLLRRPAKWRGQGSPAPQDPESWTWTS